MGKDIHAVVQYIQCLLVWTVEYTVRKPDTIRLMLVWSLQ